MECLSDTGGDQHIMPKEPGNGWKLDADVAAANLKRLGNMVLLQASRNVDLGNANFKEKKKEYLDSTFVVTSNVAHYDEWTPKEIDDRQEKLAKVAVAAWPIDLKAPPMEVSASELKAAIERSFSCVATLARVDRVSESLSNVVAWDGLVHVFDLDRHREATTAYAWTSAIEGSTKRRFYTVLGKQPINSAADAVRAAIVAEQRSKGHE